MLCANAVELRRGRGERYAGMVCGRVRGGGEYPLWDFDLIYRHENRIQALAVVYGIPREMVCKVPSIGWVESRS